MKDVTILVGTFDYDRSTWHAFCHGVSKYWLDRPWLIKATTNYLDFPCGDGLKVGKDKNWASTTKLSLQKIDSPVIFWMLDDNWLTDFPDTPALTQFTKYISDGKADYIRLVNTKKVRGAGQASFDDRLFVFSDNSKYRTSLCLSIWNRQVFIDLLKEGESVWDFEKFGPARSKKYKFCCVYAWDCEYIPHVCQNCTLERGGKEKWLWSPLHKGSWTKAAEDYALQEGLSINFSQHPKKMRKRDIYG